MNENDRYYPCIPTPFGLIPLTGMTMTDKRERELPISKDELHDFYNCLYEIKGMNDETALKSLNTLKKEVSCNG